MTQTIGKFQVIGQRKENDKLVLVNVTLQDEIHLNHFLATNKLENVKVHVEYRNKLPFIVRCYMARYGSIDIAELENIGLVDNSNRPAARRTLNKLVKLGFATKQKQGKTKKSSSTYTSVKELESESVKKFAESSEMYYLDEDINDIINGVDMDHKYGEKRNEVKTIV